MPSSGRYLINAKITVTPGTNNGRTPTTGPQSQGQLVSP